MSDAWDDLVRTALMGTARKGYLPASTRTGGEVDRLIDGIAKADGSAEAALLRVAGALAVANRAGRLPARLADDAKANADADVAPVETTPRVGDRAASRLRRLLREKQGNEVLVEWLTLCAQAQRRVPEELLVPLLEYARHRHDLHAALAPVIGERGRWLATRSHAWQYVLALGACAQTAPEPAGDLDALRATFETGADLLSRIMALREARAIDAAAAREWIEVALASEPVDNRAAIVTALAVGVSADDEALLESALDDRARSVQRAARDVLVQLPESGLVARMTERVFALVTVVDEDGEDDEDEPLQVALPASCDKAMIRDGVDRKVPAGVKLGEKAWWLRQMVLALPLETWTDRLDLDVDAFVRAAVLCDNAESMLQGLTEAARRSGDVDWIRTLLRHAGTRARGASAEGLLVRLPPAEREAYVLEVWEAGPKPVPFGPRALGLVARLEHPWSEAFSTAFVEQLGGHIENRTRNADRTLGTLILSLGGNLHPAVVPALQALFDRVPAQSYLESAMREILTTIEFRQAMHDEFTDDA